MSPTTTERPTRHPSGSRTHQRPDRSAWTCPNCECVTHPPRKRCADCGTSRY
ncbi:hypothetical protein [Geodermatophilus sp. TF02-6]|uniref:hypothetical protein n=1 Tax=Geodermatophilus sp. TF02-6 TaxID=2250575 RepID=UPI0013148867|nr:hypothetical protein [Geodermatophilus sp. TF02-6]